MTILLSLDSRDVVAYRVVVLKLIVIKDRVWAKDEFGNCIRKGRMALQTAIAFKNRRLAVAAEENQSPRMLHGRFVTLGRNKEQVNRALQRAACRDVHKCPVLEKSRIEGDKGMLLIKSIMRKVRLDAV